MTTIEPLRTMKPCYEPGCGTCENCGLPLWIRGAFKVPGEPGQYCSLLCIECHLFSGHSRCRWCGNKTDSARFFCDENCRKHADMVPFGNGEHLLRWLERNHPETYLKVSGTSLVACRQCGHHLNEKRIDAGFCSAACKSRFHRSARKTRNSGIIRIADSIESKG